MVWPLPPIGVDLAGQPCYASRRMESTFLKKMRQILEEKRAKIEAELKSFAHRKNKAAGDFDANYPEYGTKEDENASEVAEFSDNLSLEATLEGTLDDVKRALDRIDKGSYGKCKYCGKPIDERRLTARPESGSCVSCKEERLRRP